MLKTKQKPWEHEKKTWENYLYNFEEGLSKYNTKPREHKMKGGKVQLHKNSAQQKQDRTKYQNKLKRQTAN